MCLDVGDLNLAIVLDHNRMLGVEKITHELAGSTFFTKLDGTSFSLCIVLSYVSSLLTTFNAPWGWYQFFCFPWGLACAQDISQCIMDQMLDCCYGMIGIADDVNSHGKDDEEHDRCIHKQMKVAPEHCSVFNGGNCAVRQPSVTFFGYICDKDRTHPDQAKGCAMHNMPLQRHQYSSRNSLAWSYTYHYLCLHFQPSLHQSVNCSRRAWSSHGMNHTRNPLTCDTWSAQTLPCGTLMSISLSQSR